MSKKRFLIIGIISLVIVAGYFLTAYLFPKNASRFPFLVLLLFVDIYVWGLFKKKTYTYNGVLKAFTAIFYWSPFLLLAAFLLWSVAFPHLGFGPLWRNVLFGYIFTFYVSKFFAGITLGVADVFRLVQGIKNLVKRKQPEPDGQVRQKLSRRAFIENISLITGGLVMGTMFMGMFKWVHDFSIKNIFLPLPALPKAFQGYRMVQISDLHLGTWATTTAVEDAVQTINDIEPDLIVFTGDLVNYKTEEAFRFKEILGKLKAKDGILAILGNHDYGDYVKWESADAKQQNMTDLYRFYTDINWKLLRNENYTVFRDNESLHLIGVENWSVNTRFPRKGDLNKATSDIPADATAILLSHDPSHWEAQVLKNYPQIGLTLSGHTHGFQFGIEIPGIKWSPAKYIYKQWAGLYTSESSGQLLYVNRGLGSIGYPGRIGILPEITVFELQSA